MPLFPFFVKISEWNQPAKNWYELIGSKECFISGTDFNASVYQGSCVCHHNYQGQDCGIPLPMWESHVNWSRIQPRSGLQRRLIHALPVNLELDLFEGQSKL